MGGEEAVSDALISCEEQGLLHERLADSLLSAMESHDQGAVLIVQPQDPDHFWVRSAWDATKAWRNCQLLQQTQWGGGW